MTNQDSFFDSPTFSQYHRGEIWMVDFGHPIGTELGMEHPAVIISAQELNNLAKALGRTIVVPATSKRFENRQGRVLAFHQETEPSATNGLAKTSYFMTEQVRTVSIQRFRRRLGIIESTNLREIENRLCLVMNLFR